MKRCLIVDDASVIRKVARTRILESMNYECAEAENGQEALEVCRQVPAPGTSSSLTGICP